MGIEYYGKKYLSLKEAYEFLNVSHGGRIYKILQKEVRTLPAMIGKKKTTFYSYDDLIELKKKRSPANVIRSYYE